MMQKFSFEDTFNADGDIKIPFLKCHKNLVWCIYLAFKYTLIVSIIASIAAELFPKTFLD